ncbi:MAG: hypothetical protein AB7O66_06865, partial [Limisphaerales bacterium]
VLSQVLSATDQEIESHFRQIAGQHTPLARFLKDIGAPMPPPLRTAVDFVLNCDLRREFEREDPDPGRIRDLVDQARDESVEWHHADLGYVIKGRLDRRMERLAESADDLAYLARTAELAEAVRATGIDVNLWKTQNLCASMIRTVAVEKAAKAEAGDPEAGEWLERFKCLSEQLGFQVGGIGRR